MPRVGHVSPNYTAQWNGPGKTVSLLTRSRNWAERRSEKTDQTKISMTLLTLCGDTRVRFHQVFVRRQRDAGGRRKPSGCWIGLIHPLLRQGGQGSSSHPGSSSLGQRLVQRVTRIDHRGRGESSARRTLPQAQHSLAQPIHAAADPRNNVRSGRLNGLLYQ